MSWMTCKPCAGTGILVKIVPEAGTCKTCGGTGKSPTSAGESGDGVCTACHRTGLHSTPTGQPCPVCQGVGRIAC